MSTTNVSPTKGSGAPPSPLQASQTALGATFIELPEGTGAPVPAHFGDWRQEARALLETCGLVDLGWRSSLELLGEDRGRFLNGQMTCDLRDPKPGEGIYGFFTSPKGRVESDATVIFLEDRLRLQLAPGTAEAIAERLRKYIIVDRVEIRPLTDEAALVLAGPNARDWLEGDLPESSCHHRPGHCLGRAGRIVRQQDLGVEAYAFWTSADAVENLYLELARSEGGPRPAGLEALDAVRIAAGIPWFGRDFGPDNLPQESGLDEAVSYEKGCYLGQEVVARLHYRGQVSKQLRRLRFGDGPPPPPGAELQFEGRPAGKITSSSPGVGEGPALGLGMVQRRAFDEGTRLEVVGVGNAEVIGPVA